MNCVSLTKSSAYELSAMPPDLFPLVARNLPHSVLLRLSMTSTHFQKRVRIYHQILTNSFFDRKECNDVFSAIDSLSLKEWESLKLPEEPNRMGVYSFCITMEALHTNRLREKISSQDLITRIAIASDPFHLQESIDHNALISKLPQMDAINLYWLAKSITKWDLNQAIALFREVHRSAMCLPKGQIKNKLLSLLVKPFIPVSMKKAYAIAKKIQNTSPDKIPVLINIFENRFRNKGIARKALERAYTLAQDDLTTQSNDILINMLSTFPDDKKFNKMKGRILKISPAENEISMHCAFYKYFSGSNQVELANASQKKIEEYCKTIPLNKTHHIHYAHLTLLVAKTFIKKDFDLAQRYIAIAEKEIVQISNPLYRVRYFCQIYSLMLKEAPHLAERYYQSAATSIQEIEDPSDHLEALFHLLKPTLPPFAKF